MFFVVVSFCEIEIVNLERVGLGKNIDMAIVFKDFKRDVFRIDSIPSSSLDGIKEWLDTTDIKYYESRLNMNWKTILKTITDDPEMFIEEGGWEFLNLEASDSDSENSVESDQGYEPSDVQSDSESDDDDDDESASLVDSEDDEEEDSVEGDEEEEEGKTWEELEKEATTWEFLNLEASDSENSVESDQGYEPSDVQSDSKSDDDDDDEIASLVDSEDDEEEDSEEGDEEEEEGKTWEELEKEATTADREEERKRRISKSFGKSRAPSGGNLSKRPRMR